MSLQDLKRRDFITKATFGTFGAAALISACSSDNKTKTIDEPPEMPDRAPDGSAPFAVLGTSLWLGDNLNIIARQK